MTLHQLLQQTMGFILPDTNLVKPPLKEGALIRVKLKPVQLVVSDATSCQDEIIPIQIAESVHIVMFGFQRNPDMARHGRLGGWKRVRLIAIDYHTVAGTAGVECKGD